MPKWLFLALAAGSLQAAVIRGSVVDRQTGRPLARTLLTLQVVNVAGKTPRTTRTNVNGDFEFGAVPAGAYLVTASRTAFVTAQYGQKRWQSAGLPVVVDQTANIALTIRLQRFGAIAGTVIDDNEVGLPEIEVFAYRNSRPVQIAAHALTDERGAYRISGLEPGSYLVRTAAKKYDEDESYLPTFAREAARVDEARPVEVNLDQTSEQVTIRPASGRLCMVGGQAFAYPQAPISVTLISDAGIQTVSTGNGGVFHFNPVGPGKYEIFAQTQTGRRIQAAYLPITVDRDYYEARVNLSGLPDVQIVLEDTAGQPIDPVLFQVMARRKDLSGDGKPSALRLTDGHATLLPGRWDLALVPIAAYYVAGFSGPHPDGAPAARPDGWNEIVTFGGESTVKFVLSPNPGIAHGTVTDAGQKPVAGAPVVLEPFNPETHKRLGDPRVTRTDLQGVYHFYGLAPGAFRILSTFEYESPDAAAMDSAGARVIMVEQARDTAQDLDLFVLP